jgi:ABC-2 type transport system ATP-binding protein
MRRVEIARALLHRPQLLILDEPTVGLDIKARADILAHVRMLVQQEGVAVVWATHLVDEIDGNDDLVVLHRGRVLAQGSVSAIVAGGEGVGAAFTRLTQGADVGKAA